MELSFFNMYSTNSEKQTTTIYNLLSRAIITIPTYLLKENYESLPPSFQNLLSDFYSQSKETEIEKKEFIMTLMKYQLSRLNITLMMTYDCNFRCLYCFERWIQNSAVSDVLDEKSVIAWIVDLVNHQGYTYVDLCFHGGEPLLAVGKILFIAQKLKDFFEEKHIHYVFTAVTNASLLTNDIAKKLEAAGLSIIQTTIDGIREIHDKRRPHSNGRGSFDEIITNINNLKANTNIKCYVNIVYDYTSYPRICDLISYLKEQKVEIDLFVLSAVKSAHDTEYLDLSKNNQIVDGNIRIQLMELILKAGYQLPFDLDLHLCSAKQVSCFVLTPDMNVYKCISGAKMRPFYICPIDNNYDPIVEQASYIQKVGQNSKCTQCMYNPICTGHCYYDSVVEGTPNLCKKAFWNNYIPQYLELLNKYRMQFITQEKEERWVHGGSLL